MAFTSRRNNASAPVSAPTLVEITDADKAKVKSMAGKLLGFYPAMTLFAKEQGYKMTYKVVAGTEGVYGYIVVKDSEGVEVGKRQFTDNSSGNFSIYGKKVGSNYISYAYSDVSDALLKILMTDFLAKQGLYNRDAGIVDIEEDETPVSSSDNTANANGYSEADDLPM